MADAFNRRNIFEVFFAIKLLLLICLFSGCSQKAVYFFSPPQAQISPFTKSDSISVFKTATIQETLESSETASLSTKKLKIETFEAIATDKFASTETQTNYFKFPTSYRHPTQHISNSSQGTKSLKVTKNKLQDFQLKLYNAREKFPLPLFIILSLILAGLIFLFLYLVRHSSQGPPVDVLLLLPIIPIFLVWLFLAFKGLGILIAPLLGWPVFWTSIVLTLIAFLLFWVISKLVRINKEKKEQKNLELMLERERIRRENERNNSENQNLNNSTPKP